MCRPRCPTAVPTSFPKKRRGEMAYEFKLEKTVEFSETDMAGIVHFSNYFRYMEMAEHAFFRSLGFSIHSREQEPQIGWPRVQVSCEYKKPLRFEDRIEIHLLVREKRPRSLAYEVRISRIEEDGGREEVARGTLTTVCITFDRERKQMKAVAIPADIDAQIEVAPE